MCPHSVSRCVWSQPVVVLGHKRADDTAVSAKAKDEFSENEAQRIHTVCSSDANAPSLLTIGGEVELRNLPIPLDNVAHKLHAQNTNWHPFNGILGHATQTRSNIPPTAVAHNLHT